MHTTQQSAAHTTRITAILAAIGMFAPVGTDIYVAGVASIADSFSADISKAQLTFSVYFIGLAVGQVVYGPLVDRYGRRGPLWVGEALFIASSFLVVFARSIEAVIVLRLLQALGGCSGMIIGRAIVRDLFEFPRSARVYATLSVIQGVAPISAPVIGAFILMHWGWRGTFVFMGLFGTACLAASVWGLPESLPADARRKTGLFQMLRDHWELATHRPFVLPALTGAVAGSFLFAYISASPYVYMTVFGVSTRAYTTVFVTNVVGTMIAAQINRILSHKHPPAWMLNKALLFALAANVALVLVSGRAPMLVYTAFLWLAIAPLPVLFANSVAIAMRDCLGKAGVASGLLGLIQFGCAALTSAIASIWRDGTPAPMSWIMLAAISLGLALSVAIPRAGTRGAP